MDKVYHLACFSCSLCRKELQTGEQLFLVQVCGLCVLQGLWFYALRKKREVVTNDVSSQGEKFLCEKCYQISIQSLAASTAAATPMTLPTATTNMPKSEALKFGELKAHRHYIYLIQA